MLNELKSERVAHPTNRTPPVGLTVAEPAGKKRAPTDAGRPNTSDHKTPPRREEDRNR
jgi:hypothetical protein